MRPVRGELHGPQAGLHAHFAKGFLPMAVVMAMIVRLLLLQPDLGAFA